jgi:photosystem II stability/assembly factor-like uncharacterized protein
MKQTFYLLLWMLLLPCFAQAQAFWKTYTPAFNDTTGIYDIEMTNDHTAWFLSFSYNGPKVAQVLHTTDGGATFELHDLPLQGISYVPSITSTDDNTAYTMALQDYAKAVTLKTTNGGKTWQNVNTPWDPVVSWPDYIYATSTAKVCQIGDPRDGEFEIYTTGDGGFTWVRTPGNKIPDPLPGEFGVDNLGSHYKSDIWFGTNLGRIFHSANSGLNWELLNSTGVSTFFSFEFSDSQHGIVVYSSPDSISAPTFRTKDGGTTWEQLYPPFAKNYHYYGTPAYIPDTSILVATVYSTPLPAVNATWLSFDRGTSWKQVSEGEDAGWPTFRDSLSVGWAGSWEPLDGKYVKSSRVYKHEGAIVGLLSLRTLEATVEISPNPAVDYAQVRVQAPKSDDFVVLLNDAQGRLIRKITQRNTASFTERLDLQALPAGMYTVTVANGSGSVTQKLIK